MAERLKDLFFIPESVAALADAIKGEFKGFDKEAFLRLALTEEFAAMELKERMRQVTICLGQVMPKSYRQAIGILKKAAPKVKGFEAMCLPDYAELYGMGDWDVSLEALALFTRYSSSEFAIRPFIIEDPQRVMAFMLELADSDYENVRRFASEGCRPRLPWAMALPNLKKDPSLIFPILEKLKDDESEFVRKSVANNLNDISKDHPGKVLKLCKQWQGTSKRTDWIIKRACRTMLKAGRPEAMQLFGFGAPKDIEVVDLRFGKKKVRIGETTTMTFTLAVKSKKACKVRMEYCVYYVKAGGKTGKKVFQIKEDQFKPGDYPIQRKLDFRDRSTRKHFAGKHDIAIIINGVEAARGAIELMG